MNQGVKQSVNQGVNQGMSRMDVGTAELAYRIFGNGKVGIVIEAALNSCSGEWWHIAEKLSAECAVLVYDRAGYGTSSESKLERTPGNITCELNILLRKVGVDHKLVFIAHSQGGLYVQQFARLYPELVKGILLIDPLSANDNRFKELLTREEYGKSGVDKAKTYKLGALLTGLKLGFLLRPLLKKAPPFYYSKEFGKGAEEYILACLTKSRQYKTAIAENELAHSERVTTDLKTKGNFPDVPLVLITHSSKISVEEIMYYGGTTRELAGKVEEIWQSVMREYLEFSNKSSFIQAEKSSHYIHLTEPELLEVALARIG